MDCGVQGGSADVRTAMDTRVRHHLRSSKLPTMSAASCGMYTFCGTHSVLTLIFVFFFSSRRRHTRSDRDWSSDVCSSDLVRNDAAMPGLVGSSSFRYATPS